jgi:aldose 1-epimerase
MVLAAPPSGKQFSLELGDSTAVVTEVGGGLRSYCIAGTELLDGYRVDEVCSGARGQTFIPWPNVVDVAVIDRIEGGTIRLTAAPD